jgi:hypothetical protein
MNRKVKVLTGIVFSCIAMGAHAGIYADDLSKCLVESTTKDDRVSLIRWIFAAISKHPAVSSLTRVTDSDIDKANAATGALFMKLLTQTCADATKKALKYEGAASIQLSFQILGQVAMGDMMSDPSVGGAIAGLEKFVDEEKIQALATE